MQPIDKNSLVEIAYRGLLGRDPEQAAKTSWNDRLNSVSPDRMLATIVNSREFRQRYLLSQVQAGGMEAAKAICNWLLHIQIGSVLHPPRLEMVRRLVPAGAKVLDLGGASGSRQGALMDMGYPHAKDLTIVDLPMDIRFKAGIDTAEEFEHEGTKIRYAYHSMADLDRYEDESFDLVWSGQTFEHISEEEGEALFPQVKRVLKKGGFFALDTPNRTITRITVGEDNWIHAEHQVEYFYEDFLRKFEHCGMRLVDRRGILDMRQSLKRGFGVLSDLENNTINYSPETSYCFYLAYQK